MGAKLRDRVAELRSQGLGSRVIAKRCGVSVPVVERTIFRIENEHPVRRCRCGARGYTNRLTGICLACIADKARNRPQQELPELEQLPDDVTQEQIRARSAAIRETWDHDTLIARMA